MKVVLFCGGYGMRMRNTIHDDIPKPMQMVGPRPLLWHVMRYYAHFGHKDFVLCLGYRGDLLREYFLNYNECVSNDFTLSEGGRKIDLLIPHQVNQRIIDAALESTEFPAKICSTASRYWASAMPSPASPKRWRGCRSSRPPASRCWWWSIHAASSFRRRSWTRFRNSGSWATSRTASLTI